MAKKMNFLDDFIPPDSEQWKAKITADFKGDDPSSLVWESEIGPIDPVLHSFDTKSASTPHLSASDNSWLIQLAVSGAEPIVANKKILEALQEGANAIKIFTSHNTKIMICSFVCNWSSVRQSFVFNVYQPI